MSIHSIHSMQEQQGLSSITVTRDGKLVDKKNGKTITQRFVTKIYSDKLGEEARVELEAIMDKMESKHDSSDKKEKEENKGKPMSFAT